jgi:hypothetical protein
MAQYPQQNVSSTRPRRQSRPRTVAQGGNRLDRLHQLLVADRNHLDSLPEDHPRRRPTVAGVAWLVREMLS